ncbi:MAG: hypothetical protein A2W90_06815 [Bacteroidetes bacterium GWF2_42_66]|nr:MAG: hypothetical protein A2W92_01845 [Bacteroidetes bacterium GWA2_42_15]OFY02864.1 MAG: hypothetical protein A2W89_24220 [Bacteroidetes bacterium GWE2_42_39]OFY44519.1 MAG: hypothetical protein A2W90_06815 [Bacteroidetes bacterium GWF2_42_66]HAZ04634.1 hypothetical protein [Marinilabiliales bacterium]HBL74935.1 hypothetical protein [Prolixibacteraceae bacterium]
MKTIILKYKKLSVVAIFLVVWACNSDLVEMNLNPNAITKIDDKFLFTSAVASTLDSKSGTFDLRMGSQYAYIYVSPSLGRDADKYTDFNQLVYNTTMSDLYTGPLKLINEIILILDEKGPDAVTNVKLSMVNILAVCNYIKLTDLYGSVPYTEGAWARKNILYPKYDTQEYIYHDMMDKLKESITVLKSANPKDGYPGYDPLYQNDLTKWVRFANSLRLRLAMRARFVDPNNSKTVISECLAENLIEENSQNALRGFTNGDIQELNNPWYNLYITKEKWKMSELFVNQLKSTNDPRLSIFVKPNSSGGYQGIKNGLGDLDNGNAFTQIQYCSPSENLYAKDLPAYFMCADEVYFLRAEAALFQLGSGDANQLYQAGIRKSMETWKVPEAQISTFLASPEAQLSGLNEDNFRKICTQQWIGLVPNFTECYSNMRRTDYPTIGQRTGTLEKGVTDGYLPKRLLYGTDEFNSNNANVTAAVAEQGPNRITTPLWWDVK